MDINAYSPQIIIGSCIAVAAVMLIILWGVLRQRSFRRTRTLHAQFGPEYDIAVQQYGSQRRAEDALEARLHRVQALHLRSLTEEERTHFLHEWDSIQGRFLDYPRGAVTEVDELISQIMQSRGYHGARFEQRVADMTVHHARLTDPYRRANAIAVRAVRNEATTEELRSTMVLYRAVLEDLLESKILVVHRAEAA